MSIGRFMILDSKIHFDSEKICSKQKLMYSHIWSEYSISTVLMEVYISGQNQLVLSQKDLIIHIFKKKYVFVVYGIYIAYRKLIFRLERSELKNFLLRIFWFLFFGFKLLLSFEYV